MTGLLSETGRELRKAAVLGRADRAATPAGRGKASIPAGAKGKEVR